MSSLEAARESIRGSTGRRLDRATRLALHSLNGGGARAEPLQVQLHTALIQLGKMFLLSADRDLVASW